MRKIEGPGELVAMMPTLLGFTPHESIVVVAVREDGEIGGVLRVDRADLMGAAAPDLAREVAYEMARESARVALALCYTQQSLSRRCPALETLTGALCDTVPRVEALVVRGDRYFGATCEDPGCCPPRGRPIPRPPDDIVLDDPGSRGARTCEAATLLATVGAADPAERRRASRAASAFERRHVDDPARRRTRGLAVWRRALEEGAAEAPALGRLAAALSDVRVRDAALVSLIPDAGRAVNDALTGRDSPAVAAALGDGLVPRRRPDPGAQRAAEGVLTAVWRHSTRDRAAPAAGMLAVIAWWTGEQEAALDWCDAALACDPGYRLALLVAALVENRREPRGR